MLKRYIHIITCLLMATVLVGCHDDFFWNSGDGEIAVGEKVMFTSYIPEVATRSAQTDFQEGIKESYKAVAQKYEFTIKMYKKGTQDPVGSASYIPIVNNTEYSADGTLSLKYDDENTPLYWEDNVNEYGFEATTVEPTTSFIKQTESNYLLAQDKLHGYSYEPLWNDATGSETDNINTINYRTSKQWYEDNKQVYENFGQMPIGSNEYKKIPLFLQHERALVTVILKADEGVEREQLKHATSNKNIQTHIISYKEGEKEKSIDPMPEETYIDYVVEDYGGAATNVETMAYHAIVEPYNYLATAEDKPLCTINLSGQKFSFYASNDKDYSLYASELEAKGNVEDFTDPDAIRVANAYNLTKGKHLIITATLSRESRKIVITAYVEDWTDKVTTSICDDYGKNGDPEIIRTREELIAFLDNPNKNKSGSVAIISPTVLDLDSTFTADKDGNITSSTYAPWPDGKKLNCMLNLAGSVIYTEHELFSEMSSSANLVNGTIVVRKNKTKTLSAVVTEKNEGTIERVTVMPEVLAETDDPSTTSIAKVTKAGLVNKNYGTIFECTSSIPVQGTEGYVGGIAAESLKTENSSKSPVISDCTVTARVDGTNITAGGGIVGNATGRVSGNTFAYGVTVMQNAVFKNIIGQSCETTEAPLSASSNSWPTTVLNDIAGTNANPNAVYAGIIDKQEELEKVLGDNTYNNNSSKILIAADFSVNGTWTHGRQDATLSGQVDGNVLFELDGNNKTITLKGGKTVSVYGTDYNSSAMLFTNIQKDIHDLTIVVEESLIATPSTSKDKSDNITYDGLDAIAPLGYSVYGATLSNIKVKTADDKYIQAAMPGGIVAWAYGDAVIEQCEFMGKIQTWLPSNVGQSALRFAGGIAASAETATFKQCFFHTSTGTFVEASTGSTHTIYAGGIVGGIYKRDNNSQRTPLVTIKDCASQFSQTSSYKGAIVGRAQYDTNSTGSDQYANGLNSAECEGNWWGSSCKAVGQTYNGMTDIKALGARNTVDPTFNSF